MFGVDVVGLKSSRRSESWRVLLMTTYTHFGRLSLFVSSCPSEGLVLVVLYWLCAASSPVEDIKLVPGDRSEGANKTLARDCCIGVACVGVVATTPSLQGRGQIGARI